jgi:uncharacterized protein involved in exopolysaccharide biosynthesis
VTPTSDPRQPAESSVLRLLRVLVRGRLPLILFPIAAFVTCFVLTHWRMLYSAEAILRPQGTSQNANRLGGIAAQFGVALPNVSLGDPVRFQASLFKTRAVLGPVVTAQYAVATTSGSADSTRGTLLDLLNIKGRTSEDRTLRGMERLKTLMWLETDAVTGLITVRVTTRWPELSLALTQRLLEALNVANSARQQAAAEAEARFAADRLAHERAILETAEDDLEQFLKQNHQYQSSPSLVLQYGRLQRRIDVTQSVVSSLAQSYEQARIDAARDTPVVGVVDPPEGSVKEAGRPVRDGAVWALTALGLVLVFLLGRDTIERARDRQPEETSAVFAELRGAFSVRRGG